MSRDPAFDDLSVLDPVDLNAGPRRPLSRRGMTQIAAGPRCGELPARRYKVALGDLHQDEYLEIREGAPHR